VFRGRDHPPSSRLDSLAAAEAESRPASPAGARLPRKGETFADLAAGFGVDAATAPRYVNETVGLLAARAPRLGKAVRDAKKAANVVLDGTPDARCAGGVSRARRLPGAADTVCDACWQRFRDVPRSLSPRWASGRWLVLTGSARRSACHVVPGLRGFGLASKKLLVRDRE
jgi:hypothetical protein